MNLSGDIVHGCHVYPDGYGLVPVAREEGVPLTVTCHGHFLNNFTSLPPGVARQVQQTLNAASHVFCVSKALESVATEIAPDGAVSTVPIGATPKNYPTENRDTLRKSYTVPDDAILVLFCGQFIERKGVSDIIDSLAQFPDESVEYVFVGHGGELQDRLEAAAGDTDTPTSIRIKTGVETATLRDWYAMADLLMLPSYAEGRPTVIYEAMAAETAVLSTRIGGVTEQVQDGETGVLIEPGDQVELVNTLHQLVRDRSTLREMGMDGLNRLVSEGWTWEAYADEIVDIHKELAAIDG
ncbi:glycosyltransferase family 4 protein [Halorarum salinum]|uniref:Glycosyltransferase family 4 protein n=1 Tax=Halorarum salinum TaxID=2743089 RepID=A0A7D5L9F1_9EURY|nr:glycosyltransferase family 4 protein [Halobaculum salinum]QLG61090.1 glycosyltransferase family 4 protein [Halobaculum salinum]